MTFQRGVGPTWLTPSLKATYAERRAVIVAHYRESRNLAETGRRFGISRQRVWMIVQDERRRAA